MQVNSNNTKTAYSTTTPKYRFKKWRNF